MRRTSAVAILATAVALLPPAAACALAPVGPRVVGLWQGEGDATDSLGGHDGSLLGAGFAPAVSGQAFSFTGAQQAVDIPDAPDLYPTASFTVAGWVRTTDAVDFQALMGHYECGLFCPTELANSVFILGVEEGHGYAEIRDADKGGPPSEGEGQVLSDPAKSIADGADHHLAFERDSEAQELRLFVDGALAASAPLNAGASGPLENLDGEADDLYLGAYRRCSAGGAGCDGTLVSQLKGMLDDAIYWERAVSGSEIAAIHAAGPNGLTTDATAPSSAASAPASAAPGTISVTFTAADAPGPAPRVHDPSGLTRVDLYVRAPGAAAYSKVASVPGAASGSFSFAASEAGAYAFAAVASDLAGNAEALPSAPDAITNVAAPAGRTLPGKQSKPPLTVAKLIAGLPPTKKCFSRRAFTIHVVVPHGVQVLSATVLVNGRRVATRRGSRLSAPVHLRGLPKGRYAVRIVVRLAGGQTIAETRRYRTCVPEQGNGR